MHLLVILPLNCDVNAFSYRPPLLFAESERYSGTTATVCLLQDNLHLHTASVGDSRAILCRRGNALPLTDDQNPGREDEKLRIEKEGGIIVSNSIGEPLVSL